MIVDCVPRLNPTVGLCGNGTGVCAGLGAVRELGICKNGTGVTRDWGAGLGNWEYARMGLGLRGTEGCAGTGIMQEWDLDCEH
jgi:hypothetical protein